MIHKVRLTDRARYVELAAKHFALLTDKLEVKAEATLLVERLQRARQRMRLRIEQYVATCVHRPLASGSAPLPERALVSPAPPVPSASAPTRSPARQADAPRAAPAGRRTRRPVR